MNLNPKQKEASKSLVGPVLLIAGAGTGKTTVLTKRLMNLIKEGANPESILALTFTNKAAKEMEDRIFGLIKEENKPLISTFHSFCYKMMKKNTSFLPKGYDESFTIMIPSQTRKILKEIEDIKPYNEKTGETQREISFWKNKTHKERKEEMPDDLKEIMDLYQRKLWDNNSVDFDDLLNMFNKMLDDKELRKKIQREFSFVLVDEFQDTNAVQYEILKKVVNEEENIFVVGDPDQSIYKFRGADYKNMMKFKKDFEPKEIVLDENYRSTQKILDASFSVIKNNKNRFTEDRLKGSKGSINDVEKMVFDNDYAEASFIADRIKRALENGGKPSDYAVLVRNNYQTALFENNFNEKGIFYKVHGDLNFYQRREIQIILSVLMYMVSPENNYLFKDLILNIKNGIGEKTLEKIDEELSKTNDKSKKRHILLEEKASKMHFKSKEKIISFVEKIKEVEKMFFESLNFEDFISNILESLDIFEQINKMENPEERFENIETFINLASQKMIKKDTENLKTFLDNVMLNLESESDSENCVSISTIHKAKGLEFPVVFMPLLNEGVFPDEERGNEEEDIEEDRRVFYVGMTRAKNNLVVSYPKVLLQRGGTSYPPSRFYKEID